ncbi:hypothetical protein BSIN_5439 [Burkholderia singularis]|uniref:Uncharacterized protein n=1 Tax=Burkholderia singularis TaxID=1503053 RepID=A0A238GZK9_9BURK|nr:hypothetical protein BSIN_5439 [Burkholderia singularis]
MPATPPSAVGATSAALTVTACGPLQRVVHTPVKGKFFGMLINSDVDQGTTDELEPVTDENGVVRYYDRVLMPDGRTHLMGTQAIISTAVIGTAGARNLALGGGGSTGAWGQGGMGSSSANQQTQTKITLRACEVGVIEPPAPPPLPIIANIRQ